MSYTQISIENKRDCLQKDISCLNSDIAKILEQARLQTQDKKYQKCKFEISGTLNTNRKNENNVNS